MAVDLADILARLSDDARGGPVADILDWIAALREAGYDVEVFRINDERVYRATDPDAGAREQVRTVAGAVTDWTAVRGAVQLTLGPDYGPLGLFGPPVMRELEMV